MKINTFSNKKNSIILCYSLKHNKNTKLKLFLKTHPKVHLSKKPTLFTDIMRYQLKLQKININKSCIILSVFLNNKHEYLSHCDMRMFGQVLFKIFTLSVLLSFES